MDDEVLRGTTVVKDGRSPGRRRHPSYRRRPPHPAPAAKPVVVAKKSSRQGWCAGFRHRRAGLLFGAAALIFGFIGAGAPPAFLAHFTVFVLACFVGYMVVWNVKPALHTPLMSVTNAISSIIAIGALVQIAPPLAAGPDRPDDWIRWLAIGAIVLATINMFGGFAVTQRMLAMFRK
jgi:NAD(P) transhydrogenase subunit alpha